MEPFSQSKANQVIMCKMFPLNVSLIYRHRKKFSCLDTGLLSLNYCSARQTYRVSYRQFLVFKCAIHWNKELVYLLSISQKPVSPRWPITCNIRSSSMNVHLFVFLTELESHLQTSIPPPPHLHLLPPNRASHGKSLTEREGGVLTEEQSYRKY